MYGFLIGLDWITFQLWQEGCSDSGLVHHVSDALVFGWFPLCHSGSMLPHRVSCGVSGNNSFSMYLSDAMNASVARLRLVDWHTQR